jgi:hypothetical protein
MIIKTTPNIITKHNYAPGFDIKAFEDHIFKYGSKEGVSESDGGITTAGGGGDPHYWSSLEPFFNWLQPKVKVCLAEWDIAYDNFYASMSWANEHLHGGRTLPHEHGGTSVVASIYVKQPENGGNLLFERLLRDRWTAYSRISGPETIHNYWQELKVEQNDVVLFPGWLTHKTQPNANVNSNRIVFTVNFVAVTTTAPKEIAKTYANTEMGNFRSIAIEHPESPRLETLS